MDRCYFIKNTDNIVVYGASYIGREIFDKICRQNRKVSLFLDKSADEIGEVYGIKVMNPDADDIRADAEKDVVFIAVTDEDQHVGIANYLYDMGYRKIVFRSELYDLIADSYNAVMAEESMDAISIPYFSKMEYDMGKMDQLFLEKNENSYIVNVPVELLFYKSENGELRSVYQNCPLLTFYNFLEGRTDLADLKECYTDKETGITRWMECESVQYRHFSVLWQNNQLTVEKRVPRIERDKRGRYCVLSSIKEVIFQVAKGYKLIRCVMKEDDFSYWLRPDIIKDCIANMETYRISFVYTPILHPFFYDFPCRREAFGLTRLMKICQYLQKKNIDVGGKRVLDAGTYIGYFAQHMYRMGADVTAVEFERSNYSLAGLLNKLLYCDDINLLNMGIQDIDSNGRYHIAILMSVLNWHLDTPLGKEIIEKIDEVTTEFLIWESGDEIEREKNWILEHSSFCDYEKISDTFGTGKIRELGVFRK